MASKPRPCQLAVAQGSGPTAPSSPGFLPRIEYGAGFSPGMTDSGIRGLFMVMTEAGHWRAGFMVMTGFRKLTESGASTNR